MTAMPLSATDARQADAIHASAAGAAALDSHLETCACPLCGGERAQPTPYAHGPYKVVRCGDCGLWFLSPRPTPAAAAAFYASDDYFTGGEAGYGDYAGQERGLRRTFRRLLDQLARQGATGGSLMEVGSGLGYMLDEARSHFAERTGIELSPAAAEAAARLSGATVECSLDAIDPTRRFDCIAALHVIEHIHDPVAFAHRLAGHLKPGGTLVLAAPDMGSFWRKAMGRRWPSFKYPEHLLFFDRHTLARLMAEAGLEAATPLPYLHDFQLSEVLGKLGLPAPSLAGRLDVPLPATTVCYMARKGREVAS